MLISEYIRKNSLSLSNFNKIEERESQTILRFLIEDSLQINRIDFSSYLLNKQEIELLNRSVERLENNEPLQYITKKAYFYGLEFEVSPAVLIPRPETEEMVHQVLKDFETKRRQKQNHTFLEVGTGSGCISIALAKNLPNFHFIAIDVSKNALEIAKKNAQTNKVNNIEFIELNFLNENLYVNHHQLKNAKYIVSNPPYIRESEKLEMNKNVLNYEPHIALFVEDKNPLVFYEAVANFFANYVKDKEGLIYVEINQYLANETKDVFKGFGLENIIVFKDLQDKTRFIRASK